jgi:cardiolipin synthase (CMP-forming)
MKDKLKLNLPNILTLLRIIIIPFFTIAILNKLYVLAIVLFSLGAISDVLDGYIARKYDLVSEFGKVADPIADKLMQFAALLSLTINGDIPVLIIVIIGTKELIMGIGTIILFKKKQTFNAANWYGKITTILIYAAVVLLLFEIDFGIYILYASIITAVYSFFMYGFLAKKKIKDN